MKRLTQRIKTGEVLMAPEYEEKCTTEEWICVLQDRLAAYEDTGWSPQACAEAREAGKVLSSCDISFGRLAELLTADKDGRVVVPPCKVGDKLYRVFAGEIFEHRVGNMKYFAIQGRWDIETYPFCPCVESSIGKTVFLSHKEAEKVMKGETEK